MKDKIKSILQDICLGISDKEICSRYEYSRTDVVTRLKNRYIKKGFLLKFGNNFRLSEEALKIIQDKPIINLKKKQIEVHKLTYQLPLTKKLPNWLSHIEERASKHKLDPSRQKVLNGEQIIFNFSGLSFHITENLVRIFLQDKKVIFNSIEEYHNFFEEKIRDIIPKLEAILMVKLPKEDGIYQIFLNQRHIAFLQHPLAKYVQERGFRLEVYDENGRKRLYTDNSDGNYHLETDRIDTGSDDIKSLEKDLKETIDGYSKKSNFSEIERLREKLLGLEEESLTNDIKAMERMKILEKNQLKLISHIGLITEHLEPIVKKISKKR